jgi:putative transcriptional regulator
MTASITRHPAPDTLMSYAAGTLPEPLAAVMAAHIDLCPACRAEVRDLELMGALLLADTRATADQALPIPHRPPADAPLAGARPAGRIGPADKLPAPIARHFGLTFETIPWRRLGPGLWHHRLPLSPGVVGDLRLIRVGPGYSMPEHGHGGAELTLVLHGAFCDATGHYAQGDVQNLDTETEHQPVADPVTGCICLFGIEQPTRFKNRLLRLLQPLTGM